jgi:hypothetical protein
MKHLKMIIKRLCIAIMILWTLLGIASGILYAIIKVRTGHGLDYYLTGEGVEMNYVGFLVAISVIAIALFISWLIRIWSVKKDEWLINRLSRK